MSDRQELDTSIAGPEADDELLRWSSDEARVLGALMEKGLATPQNYPLSLNALTLACNQATNRDPVTALGESRVQDVLTVCKTRGLARFVHPRSGRGVTKYRHVVDEALAVGEPVLALLSVLLLRGPQTVGELRSRTERLHPFDDSADIELALTTLTDGQGSPLVRQLERESGHREARWIQLLSPEQGEDRAGQMTAPPIASVAPQPAATDDVDQLRRELAELRAEFEAFRAEFD